MAAMPNFEAEIARDWQRAEHFMRRVTDFRHHDDGPQPAGTPAPDPGQPQPAAEAIPAVQAIPEIPTTPEENTMSQVITDLENDAKALIEHAQGMLGKFQNVDHAALDGLEAIKANPVLLRGFQMLAQLAGLPVTADDLSHGMGVLEIMLRAAGGQVPAQQ